MHHIVYKTTNIKNGKIYIGIHSTSNLDDSYLGSGSLLKNAISYYGKDCFVRETIYVGESRKEISDYEARIVTEDFCNRRDTYNVKTGGEESYKHSDKTKEKIRQYNLGKTLSSDHKEKIKNTLTGRTLSDETKLKMSNTHKGKKMSNEHRQKFHASRPEKHSDETKNQISQSLKNKPDLTCPHCRKTGKYQGMKRWHFNNCKDK